MIGGARRFQALGSAAVIAISVLRRMTRVVRRPGGSLRAGPGVGRERRSDLESGAKRSAPVRTSEAACSVADRHEVDSQILEPALAAPDRLVQLVDVYCRRVYPAVLAEHSAGSVCSPLGVWLLLAASVSAATGSDRADLEAALGCPAAEARDLLTAFVVDAPSALHAGLAVWVRAGTRNTAVREWCGALPSGFEVGPMPSQAQVDAWARRHTAGLIRRFPVRLDEALLVLASVLATEITWSKAFEVVARQEHFTSNRWLAAVQHVLLDRSPARHTMLAATQAAGVVAVHLAVAAQDLAVLSVSADPAVPRGVVLEAAHEVAGLVRGAPSTAVKRSLFELPVGVGHSWVITRRKIATCVAGERVQRIGSVILPAWCIETNLDLTESDLFGAPAALSALCGLLDPKAAAAGAEAAQTAVASYTRSGFRAAAITAFAAPSGTSRPPREHGVERVADLRFDHPHAAIALAGRAASFLGDATQSPWFGLPLFTVWVDRPAEAEHASPAAEREELRR